jgi:hypothetical protein
MTEKSFCCIKCKYFCSRNANLQKHLTSKKHALNSRVIELDPNCKYQCKLCNKKYLSQPGLWVTNVEMMEYFDENYKQSHLYLSQRKLIKDCLDGNNQVKLINKIIGNHFYNRNNAQVHQAENIALILVSRDKTFQNTQF